MCFVASLSLLPIFSKLARFSKTANSGFNPENYFLTLHTVVFGIVVMPRTLCPETTISLTPGLQAFFTAVFLDALDQLIWPESCANFFCGTGRTGQQSFTGHNLLSQGSHRCQTQFLATVVRCFDSNTINASEVTSPCKRGIL